MNYQEFLTTIRTQLSLRIETGVTLDIRSFTKNNGTHYDGLVLLHPKKNVSPAIYLMPYYHRYLEGVCLEEICEDILHTYQAHAPEENFDTSYFTDFSRASEHIVMRLVSFEKNQELLKEVPFFRYQDLAVIFYCLLHASAENQANILIHNHHLNLWKTDKETLDRLLDTLGMKERRNALPACEEKHATASSPTAYPDEQSSQRNAARRGNSTPGSSPATVCSDQYVPDQRCNRSPLR